MATINIQEMSYNELKGIIRAADTTVTQKVEAAYYLEKIARELLNAHENNIAAYDADILAILDDSLEYEKNLLNANASDINEDLKSTLNNIKLLREENLRRASDLGFPLSNSDKVSIGIPVEAVPAGLLR